MKRSAVGTAVLALLLVFQSPLQAANLIVNGGFETTDALGNFLSPWTLGDPLNDFSSISPTNFPTPINNLFYVPHSGTMFAALANSGTTDTLSQTVVTTPGQQYALSFWVGSDGLSPNEFGSAWDATTLDPVVYRPSTVLPGTSLVGYVEHTFTVTGTGSDTLTFTEQNDNGFLLLDDVSLTPITTTTPEPTSLILLSVGALGMAGYGWRRRRAATA